MRPDVVKGDVDRLDTTDDSGVLWMVTRIFPLSVGVAENEMSSISPFGAGRLENCNRLVVGSEETDIDGDGASAAVRVQSY